MQLGSLKKSSFQTLTYQNLLRKPVQRDHSPKNSSFYDLTAVVIEPYILYVRQASSGQRT